MGWCIDFKLIEVEGILAKYHLMGMVMINLCRNIDWLEPWDSLCTEGSSFEQELYKELGKNHVLDSADDNDMIKNKKASAFYDPWKFKINKIQKGDKVFLYRSGTGTVAMGKGNVDKIWNYIIDNCL